MDEKIVPTWEELKVEWVAALRSGKYRQGRYHLCRRVDDFDPQFRYCCLGVLMDIVGERMGIDSEEKTFSGSLTKLVWKDPESQYINDKALSHLVAEQWFEGVQNPVILIEHGDKKYVLRLTQINDNSDSDFALIANLIEASSKPNVATAELLCSNNFVDISRVYGADSIAEYLPHLIPGYLMPKE